MSSAAANFSPDGETVVTASLDNTAWLWKAKTGEALRELKGHKSDIVTACFSKDGKRLLTACIDGIAKVWEPDTGELSVNMTGTQMTVTTSGR